MEMKIVVSASNFQDIEKTDDVSNIVELRLDLFKILPAFEEIEKITKPKIVTVRKEAEGGAFKGNEDDRYDIFMKYSSIAEYVDVEFDSEDRFFDLTPKIIESYHNFVETPDYKTLKEIIGNRKGDIFKIATLGKSKRDVEVIFKILLNNDNVIAFLMGEKFAFTRIVSLFMGSPFIYCHAGKSIAAGQIEAHEANRFIKILKGNVKV